MNRKSFDELAQKCNFQKPAPYFIIEDGVKKDGPMHCISNKRCEAKNCPLFMWFDVLFGGVVK